MISPNQTAFVKKRQISENFIATCEILHHIAHQKRPAIFLKLDFAKAFDFVNWKFLLKIMRQRGFPERWLGWIDQLLKSSSSCVIVNSEPSDYFQHKKGLRQGDLLSPMLFLLAADILQEMIKSTNATLSKPISHKISDSILAMQYADDTAIVESADLTTLISLKLI